jgi:hypothetical protein
VSRSIVLLPAWPCDQSVRFKLNGPLSTTVEVDWDGGAVLSKTTIPLPDAADHLNPMCSVSFY